MMYAQVNDQRAKAEVKGQRAKCPGCGSEVLAKCGSIVVNHWAHVAADCDNWSEPETPWHREWKEDAPSVEVWMPPHRADVVSATGRVIELQHSAISSEEIARREAHYGNMLWLFDARAWKFEVRRSRNGAYNTFRWKHPHKTLWSARRPLFFDLGYKVFEVRKLYPETPCGGWGYVWWRSDFHRRFFWGEATATPTPWLL